MTVTHRQAAKLRKLIRELVEAERKDVMRGAQYPEDWPVMDEALRIARVRLGHHLDSLHFDD